MVNTPAIITITSSAEALARTLVEAGLGQWIDGTGRAAETLLKAFREGRPVIALCSAGIIIRTLAPALTNKNDDAPVIAVAEDASVAVPLLGGHRGANLLARKIAKITGGTAALTTASDLRFDVALDEPPAGYMLANRKDVARFTSHLLKGAKTRIEGKAPWFDGTNLPIGDNGELTIKVTHKAYAGHDERLVFHPRTLTLGVGCARGASAETLIGQVDEILHKHALSRHAIAAIGSIALKADEAAIGALADHLAVPARFFSQQALAAQAHRLANPSETVLREVGVPGVAEAAALALAGVDGHLIVEKTRTETTTCAIAQAPSPVITPAGQARGTLFVVGIGPGGADWRSAEAVNALAASEDWVGYGLYLDLAADMATGAVHHRFALGKERARCHKAIELAGEGKTVALVCSGDAAIYAMASLVCEELEYWPEDSAKRIAVRIVPGISAFQAASARAGALIGHDFCTISLSDLLTPWPVINARIEAAARADFAIAFYNPRSSGRAGHLGQAMAILRRHRPDHTPVAVASELGRPGEHVKIVRLDEFNPETVDMLTVVLVGASTSRAFSRGDGNVLAYTPRGYASKVEAAT